jgi:hypothetical protein
MKTSTPRGAVREDIEARLAAYECQAVAHLASHPPRQEDVEVCATASVPVPPDLAAPGFVSFTGGPSRESVKAGAPRDVVPAHAAFYAGLDKGVSGESSCGFGMPMPPKPSSTG